MNLRSLTLPDDPLEFGGWLNELIISPDLGRTIAELKIMMKGRTETQSQLADIVSESDFDKLCDNGFGALTPEQCRLLIAQPELLLKIEDRILEVQPDFWLDRMKVHSAPPFEVLRKRLPNYPERVTTAAGHAQADKDAPLTRRSWFTWGAIAAVAASTLVVMWLRNPTAPKGWGFNKPGMLVADVSEAVMLQRLEGLADEWYKKTPDSKASLVKRLKQYENGCQTLLELLDTSLHQLSDNSRRAVRSACFACLDEIGNLIADLDSGKDFQTVLLAANSSIDKLKKNIREAG